MASVPTHGAPTSAWVEYKNAQGRAYWYNLNERRSVWEKPNELKSARERAMDTTPWREYKSGDRSYYVNKETKQSTWTMPADLRAYLDTIPDEPAPAVARSSVGANASPRSPMTPPSSSATPVHDAAGPGTAALRQVSATTRHATLMYASQEEAESAFMSLLKRKNIGPDATWEQTLREIITEPLYKALRTLAERKAVFHRYVDELKAKEAARREEKSAELRPKMSRALQQAGGLAPYASFATFKKKLGGHALWSELEDEAQAESIFEAIRRDVREKEASQKKALALRTKTQFLALLRTIDITPLSRWRDVQQTVTESDGFKQDAQLQAMPLVEQLRTFEEHMASVEAEERQRRDGKTNTRHDRKAREAFKTLLQERIGDGTLHARSTWASFFPRIRDDERLVAMTDTSGSTAQDLFYDVLDTQEREFAAHMRVVQTYMREKDVRAAKQDDWAQWKAALESEDAPESIKSLSEPVLRALFDECVYQAEREARDARRRAERRLRHYADDLRYALKHVDPPLDIHASFDEVLPRIRTLPEYMALVRAGGDDELRHGTTARAAWDRFVRRQAEKLVDGRPRSDYMDLDDAGDHKRKEGPRYEDPRSVRRRTEYDT